MDNTQIKKSQNNTEKRETYRYLLGRYKRAVANEFYFEALIIVYAMLEDRMKSFLYYCGYFANRNQLRLYTKTRNDILATFWSDSKGSKAPSFMNISTKIDFSRNMLEWAETVEEKDITGKEYLIALKKLIENLDVDGMIETLENLRGEQGWLRYRNEIIHASLNKNIDALYEGLGDKVESGMEYDRFIDSQVKLLKKSNFVRRKMKMQNN